MFWSLIMEPQRRYKQVVKRPFHISMAALDISASSEEATQLMCGYEGRNYLLCTLRKPDILQVPLDLNFEAGDELALATNGKCHVHLTGYLLHDAEELSEEGEFEEDLEEEDEEVEEEEEVEVKKKNKKRNKQEILNGPPTKKMKSEKIKDFEEDNEDEDKDEDDDDDDDDDDSDSDSELGLKNLLDDSFDSDEIDDTFRSEEAEEDQDEDELEEEEEIEESLLSEDESEEEKVVPKKRQKNKSKMNGVASKQESQSPSTSVLPKQHKEKKNKQNQQQKEDKNSSIKSEKQSPKKESPKKVQNGLIIEDLKEGQGQPVKAGKLVTVYYEGRLKSNNKVFDSTKQGQGFTFKLGGGNVIKGWDLGLVGMKTGGKRKITCPPNLAYGVKGSPPVIPGNSTLVFEVELKKVR